MSTADTALMTAEEFLALPDDGKERWLIDGQMREKDDVMTYRNRFHSYSVGRIAQLVWNWLDDQPQPRGAVLTGDAGCILRRDPDTVVGIDVAYFSPGAIDRPSDETSLIDVVPVLAVEVLSPSDKQVDVHEKVSLYLDVGVQAVWVVDPFFRTVQVHRPGNSPQTFNDEQTLSGGELLPGLEFAVSHLFAT